MQNKKTCQHHVWLGARLALRLNMFSIKNFFFKLVFLVFLYCFDVLMSKINFKKIIKILF